MIKFLTLEIKRGGEYTINIDHIIFIAAKDSNTTSIHLSNGETIYANHSYSYVKKLINNIEVS